MRVIGVLDLKAGQVVHAVAGTRCKYGPVNSVLCDDSRPATVASALVQRLQLREAYVADLDAIAGGEPDWQAYGQVAKAGLRLWLDAGQADLDRLEPLIQYATKAAGPIEIVAGSETVHSRAELAAMACRLAPARLVFSLDLKSGRPITRCDAWRHASPETILREALDLGLERFIVLDLAHVGTVAGVATEAVCRQLRAWAPEAEIVSGGGVRNVADIRALQAAGCDAVLVASALHNGALNAKDCRG